MEIPLLGFSRVEEFHLDCRNLTLHKLQSISDAETSTGPLILSFPDTLPCVPELPCEFSFFGF